MKYLLPILALVCLTGCHSDQQADNAPPQQAPAAVQSQQSAAAPASAAQPAKKQIAANNHLIDENSTAGVRGGDVVNVTFVVTRDGKSAKGLPLEVRAKGLKTPMTTTTDDWGEAHMALPAGECTVVVQLDGRMITQHQLLKGEMQQVKIEVGDTVSN